MEREGDPAERGTGEFMQKKKEGNFPSQNEGHFDRTKNKIKIKIKTLPCAQVRRAAQLSHAKGGMKISLEMGNPRGKTWEKKKRQMICPRLSSETV